MSDRGTVHDLLQSVDIPEKKPTRRQKDRQLQEQREQAIQNAETAEKKVKLQKYQPEWFPWDAIEEWFVQGAFDEKGAVSYPTIDDIIVQYGAGESTLRRRIADGKWLQKREQWQRELHQQSQAQSMQNLLEAANKFDAVSLETAQRAIEEILNHLVIAKAAGRPVGQLELDRLGRSMVNWQRVGRLALGLSTDNRAAKLETSQGTSITSLDLTAMTQEELELLEKIAMKAEARSRPHYAEGTIEETE